MTEPYFRDSSIGFFIIIGFLLLFYCCSSTGVCTYPPSPLTPAILTSLPWYHPPLVLSMCPLLFLKTLPFFPPIIPPTSPLITVRLFLISMSLVIFCLLVCFVHRFQYMVLHHLFFEIFYQFIYFFLRKESCLKGLVSKF